MNRRTSDRCRSELLARRAVLRRRWREELSEQNEVLAAHEPEWEETPAARTVILIFDTVNGLERRALARIQGALARLERGTYGECVGCHGAIDEDRLAAVPDTDRCDACARRVN
jgi:RNA polymerase-binding transcription factor DksA